MRSHHTHAGSQWLIWDYVAAGAASNKILDQARALSRPQQQTHAGSQWRTGTTWLQGLLPACPQVCEKGGGECVRHGVKGAGAAAGVSTGVRGGRGGEGHMSICMSLPLSTPLLSHKHTRINTHANVMCNHKLIHMQPSVPQSAESCSLWNKAAAGECLKIYTYFRI